MSGSAIARPRVLIVEDEPIVAAGLQLSLEELGYEVVGTAESGPKAIAAVDQTRPGLVLMDIQIRGQADGISVADEIRRRWHIPVVFITGNANDATVARARETAPYGYLLKPLRPKELNATLLVALHQHRLARELFAEQNWLRITLTSLSDGVIATDAQGDVRYLNPVAEQLTGWTLHDAIGKPVEEVYPLTTAEGTPVELCQVRKALESGGPTVKAYFVHRNRNGRAIPVEESAVPILDKGKLEGAVTVFRDITDRLRREREQEGERDRLEEQVQATTKALGQTRAELRSLSQHLMTAQEEERRRVARELHDDFAQRTALIEMYVVQLAASAQSAEARELYRVLQAQLTALSKGLREVSHRLHPSVITDLGLVAALRQLVTEFRENHVEASFVPRNIHSEPAVEVSTALYRITQEALRNVQKHAPEAAVRVTLASVGDALHLSIEDSGPGFDLDMVRTHGGLGLVSMQERARLAGGSLLIRTGAGGGTAIRVHVPINVVQVSQNGLTDSFGPLQSSYGSDIEQSS